MEIRVVASETKLDSAERKVDGKVDSQRKSGYFAYFKNGMRTMTAVLALEKFSVRTRPG
jgi:hypothetical protein